nr:hypothetical protein [Tanacetum cinerariifolium]
VAGVSLEIAAAVGVEGVGFDGAVQRLGVAQGGVFSAGPVVLGQAVEAERQRVNLLFGIERPALVIDRPVHAAVRCIQKVRHEVRVGPPGHGQVAGLRLVPVSGRKRPQDARVQHRAFGGQAVGLVVVVELAVEAAVLGVGHAGGPVGQDAG